MELCKFFLWSPKSQKKTATKYISLYQISIYEVLQEPYNVGSNTADRKGQKEQKNNNSKDDEVIALRFQWLERFIGLLLPLRIPVVQIPVQIPRQYLQ